jgi:pimeloyl-ACP methyl ester carboxylesterase
MENYAADLAALLDELQIDVCAMVGCSFGGMVALQFVTTWPERVAALCLTDTSPAYESERYDEAFRERERDIDRRDDIVRRFGTAELGKRAAAGVADPFLAEGIRKRFAAMSAAGFNGAAHARRSRPDVTPLLASRLTMPVLLCTGDRDPVRCAFEVMAQELPGARAVTFKECGHGVPSIRPDAFLDVLGGFLSDVEDGKPVAGRRTV